MATKQELYRTPPGDLVQTTARLRSDTAAWVYELAAAHDATLSATILQIIEDRRLWWGLDAKDVAALRADAKALGLSEREYIYYLVLEEARKLLEEGTKGKGNR